MRNVREELEKKWKNGSKLKSELLPEWVVITKSVPKLTGTIEGTSQQTGGTRKMG